MLKCIKILLASIGALFLVGLAYATKPEREFPLHLTAEKLSLDQTNKSGVFIGQVEIKQGPMFLQADKVLLREDQGGYRYVQGEGNPVKFQQKTELAEPILAEALSFTYDEKMGRLTLYDRVWVKQGEQQILSDVIVYDIKQEHYSAKTQKNRRVSIVFTPKKKSEDQKNP